MKKSAFIYGLLFLIFIIMLIWAVFWQYSTCEYILPEKVPRIINKINLNTASAEQLRIIPGIGETLSNRIVEYRTTYGPFSSVEELMNIEGFGNKLLSDFLAYTTIGE